MPDIPRVVNLWGMKFDGWDVLLGGAIACLFTSVLIHDARTVLLWVAASLGALWIVAVILSNLGFLPSRRNPKQASQHKDGPPGSN